MTINKLPPQLVSLVHHITLNEAGWWEKTIQRIIIASIWLSEKGILNKEEIKESIVNNFALNLSQTKVNEQTDVLISKSILLESQKNSYKISEEELKKFNNELADCEAIEQQAKDRFIELCHTFCKSLNPEQEWKAFNDELIAPLVHDLGAKTYELISGQDGSLEQTSVQKYLLKFPPNSQPDMKKVIVGFLDPKHQKVREFVLRKINAYFCLEAGNLSDASLQKLTSIAKQKVSFSIFVDTNFLFSVLGLHENPSNEAAQSLLALIKEISSKIEIKLFVSPITIKEATDVISFHADVLKNIRLTRNMIGALDQIELSGFSRKFFAESEKLTKPISAEDYFAPYLKNFISVIKSKGVEFYNRNLDSYTTDQRVIDVLTDRMSYEQRIFKEKAKTYEQLLHDIVLWYFVRDSRLTIVESPAAAKHWIVTVDFRYLGFDAYNSKKMGYSVPVCIHPASLIQMLQFWIPRSIEFEEAVMANLRYPFLFHEFDTGSEKITLKILGTLSRYEECNDLSEETIVSILLNDALRKKISSTRDIQEQIDLVKDTIISELNKIKQESDEAKKEAQKLSKDLSEKEHVITILNQELEQLNGQKNENEISRKFLDQRIRELENEIKARIAFNKADEDYRNDKDRFITGKWENFSKDRKIMWIFLFLFMVISLFLIFLIRGNAKYLPLIVFISIIILSFFNRVSIGVEN